MKHKWLDHTVLRGVNFVLCTSEKDYLKVCKHLNVKDPLEYLARPDGMGAATHTLTNERTGEVNCVVCINIVKRRSVGVLAALLAHEATHVMQAVFKRIGERYPGDEIQAYAIENITRELIDDYQRQAKLKKKK
jgi:predicted metal-dependent peptidase